MYECYLLVSNIRKIELCIGRRQFIDNSTLQCSNSSRSVLLDFLLTLNHSLIAGLYFLLETMIFEFFSKSETERLIYSGMHLGCAIGQMAQKNYQGRTFRKTVRPTWRTVFPSGALFENWCARLFTCSSTLSTLCKTDFIFNNK